MTAVKARTLPRKEAVRWATALLTPYVRRSKKRGLITGGPGPLKVRLFSRHARTVRRGLQNESETRHPADPLGSIRAFYSLGRLGLKARLPILPPLYAAKSALFTPV